MKRRRLLSVLVSGAAAAVTACLPAASRGAVPRPPGGIGGDAAEPSADGTRFVSKASYERWIAQQQEAARALLEATGVEADEDLESTVEEESKANLERQGIRVPSPPVLLEVR